MKYLLDVNALVALGFIHHEFHGRVSAWIKAQRFPELATCSITELGFVRVLSQAPAYGFAVMQARNVLLRMKKAKVLTFTFITDSHDISHLPASVKSPRQTTDGHLVELARVSGAILATLDEKVPGSYRIP
jgi:uncharacterized protein